MSVASEVNRIQAARNLIRSTLVAWGVAQSGDDLDALADALAADLASGTKTVLVITSYTFASDLGAALGPMGGYAFINIMGVPAAYAAVGVLLVAMGLVWTLRGRSCTSSCS